MNSQRGARTSPPFLLTTTPPGRTQWRFAVCVLLALVGALLVAAPFARVPLSNTEILLPAYAAGILVCELITAALLLALFAVQQSNAVLVLSIGYLFSGLMVIPWMLTFPGVFASLGVPDAGLQSTAAIAAVRRLGFPLFVLAYALTKELGPSAAISHGSVARVIRVSVAGVVAVTFGLSWFIVTSHGALPGLMRDARNVSALWQYVPATAVCLYVAGLVILWIRRRSVLDLWLMIVLCTLLIETALLSYLSSGLRLSVGWWAGRLYGLVSASVVLLVLLTETMTLYARLARSISAERRARQGQLTAMEAFSASIAHEVSQPLASMVTNADAGLRWLARQRPDLAEAQASMERIVSDGHRAGKVVEGISSMFRKGPRERDSVHLNRLINEVLSQCRSEAQLGRVYVQAELDDGLPAVTGSPAQLHQVLANLVANAIDAMTAIDVRERVLRIKSEILDEGGIMVSVEDSGIGLNPEDTERIFEPFFTTRADGMGMGLMYCRSVIESHGGRLWTTPNRPHGAIFRFTLPAAEDRAPAPGRRVP